MPINLEKWVTFKGEEQAAKQSVSPRHELGMFRENGAGLRGAPTGLGQGDGPHHQLAGTKAGVAPTTELPIWSLLHRRVGREGAATDHLESREEVMWMFIIRTDLTLTKPA